MRLSGIICFGLWLIAGSAMAEVSLNIVYLRQIVAQPPTLSNLDPEPGDQGLAGAKLGLQDNRTTGQFLDHSYDMMVETVAPKGDLLTAAKAALARSPFLLVDAPASDLLRIADLPTARDAILINVSAPDMALRSNECRRNLLHSIPSVAMRADALMQFFVHKRWTNLAMIAGPGKADQQLALAFRHAIRKFGLRLRAEKTWNFDADMRRSAAQEVPLFTQELGKHDALLIADALGDYGRYIAYNTWLARPVAGSEGIVPAAWSPVMEQWGAAQLQGRFFALANRPMRPRDYAAWAAMRALGEAATRTNSAAPEVLRAYVLSDAFELAGFKGRPMSFRQWNGQLRQPISLSTSRALVAQAPLEGFLHQRNELDTLGLDAPESQCSKFED